jgi:protein gp37
MKNTLISWCHHTVNFWWGCAKVSLGCKYCYALEIARRFHPEVDWTPGGKRWIRADKAGDELHARAREAHKRGVRERVFINSMSDTFEDGGLELEKARQILFTRCWEVGYALDLLILTKRPENILPMVPRSWTTGGWPPWVWIGTSVESDDQRRRIWDLLWVRAKVLFLSCEPLLGALDLTTVPDGSNGAQFSCLSGRYTYWEPQNSLPPIPWPNRISWVIVGGESGPRARTMSPEWAQSLRSQCKDAGVAFWMKQLGGWPDKRHQLSQFPEDLRVRELPCV